MTTASPARTPRATVAGVDTAGPPQRVALVNMPFAAAARPSIQCGLLKAALTRAGLRSDNLLGEWLFSVAAFGPRSDEEAYRQAFPSLEETCERIGYSFEDLCRLRNETLPALIERWATTSDWSAYDVVGFTSTFEQNVAALALARRLKELYSDVVTAFGGANYYGEMGPEYVSAFPWIDYAVVGEGDEALPAIVARLAQGR